jgi:hypothetical protein
LPLTAQRTGRRIDMSKMMKGTLTLTHIEGRGKAQTRTDFSAHVEVEIDNSKVMPYKLKGSGKSWMVVDLRADTSTRIACFKKGLGSQKTLVIFDFHGLKPGIKSTKVGSNLETGNFFPGWSCSFTKDA